jgi:hypothetical protein
MNHLNQRNDIRTKEERKKLKPLILSTNANDYDTGE